MIDIRNDTVEESEDDNSSDERTHVKTWNKIAKRYFIGRNRANKRELILPRSEQ